MKVWTLGLLLWLTASCSLGASRAVTPVTTEDREKRIAELLHFDETGRLDDKPSRKAAGLQLDMFAAYLPTETDIKVGVGLVLWRNDTLRATAQVADGVIGAGLAYTFVPVVDLAAGAGLFYHVNSEKVFPTVFVSIYRW